MTIACTIALVLALDLSHSVNEARWIQQRDGHAQAITSNLIINHIESTGPIALAVVGFGNRAETLLQWTVLRNRQEVNEFSNRIHEMERPALGFETSIYDGLSHSISLHLDNTIPCVPERQVIDLAADGVDNRNEETRYTRQHAIDNAIQVNGVTINSVDIYGNSNQRSMELFFRANVITPDGFIVASSGFEEIARAVQKKLELEIIGAVPNEQITVN